MLLHANSFFKLWFPFPQKVNKIYYTIGQPVLLHISGLSKICPVCPSLTPSVFQVLSEIGARVTNCTALAPFVISDLHGLRMFHHVGICLNRRCSPDYNNLRTTGRLFGKVRNRQIRFCTPRHLQSWRRHSKAIHCFSNFRYSFFMATVGIISVLWHSKSSIRFSDWDLFCISHYYCLFFKSTQTPF